MTDLPVPTITISRSERPSFVRLVILPGSVFTINLEDSSVETIAPSRRTKVVTADGVTTVTLRRSSVTVDHASGDITVPADWSTSTDLVGDVFQILLEQPASLASIFASAIFGGDKSIGSSDPFRPFGTDRPLSAFGSTQYKGDGDTGYDGLSELLATSFMLRPSAGDVNPLDLGGLMFGLYGDDPAGLDALIGDIPDSVLRATDCGDPDCRVHGRLHRNPIREI